MKFSRRSFLQGVTASIASYWGWQNQSILSPSQLNAYGAILNPSAARKLALLVGIDRYSTGSSLTGCKTDVELQKELLVHRFGFQPQDILTLTDKKATRKNIITFFKDHLQQAAKDEVVLFHFSGYGRKVKADGLDSDTNIFKSLIAYDTIEASNKQVDDILLDTLINLAENLNTDKYTLILDTSFTPPSTSIQKQISLRGYDYNPELKISKTELEFNQQLANNSSSPVKIYQKKPKLSGLVLLPSPENIAVEIKSSDFNAGLFTYTLTQSLWTNFAPNNYSQLNDQIATKISLYSNQPTKIDLSYQKLTDSLNYHLPFLSDSQGIGIITETSEGNIVELELLGLPLLLLLNYGINSLLKARVNQDNITIQIDSLTGNIAKGKVISGDFALVKPGLIVQESVRVIPAKLGLKIGLNDNLKKIEKVDATSALSTINVVSSASSIGSNFVDYILDKSDENNHHGYSLFSPTGVPLKYTNPTAEHEGVYSAVKRFEEFMYLDFDLAYKFLNLTYNEYSSTLAVTSSLEVNSQNSISQFTKYTSHSTLGKNSQKYNYQLINIPQNSSINIKLSNQNRENLYYLLFEINPSKELLVYNNPRLKYIQAGKSQSLPNSGDNFKWFINSNKGVGELIIVCAKSPFTKTLEVLNKKNGAKLENEQVLPLKNSVEIAKSVMEDLHVGSNVSNDSSSDIYALDMNHWTTFSFVYEVT
jgi:hypothetical protein